ncbi:hypothetical protein DPEC_G00046170 [Dallia pectoralis]|uniref:Uncharacterized protein n=1 Tax=Dallia pectoralis TaxID=75939 RepID=A0ACC2HAW1_DALPE|nr:hypothetical protein DPEC_G00046170 [Dallia pectoralis]
MVSGNDSIVGCGAVATSPSRGRSIPGSGNYRARARDIGTSEGLAPERDRLTKRGLSADVIRTIQSARASSTSTLYSNRWSMFVRWCETNTMDPVCCPVEQILSFLQYLLDKRRSASTIKGYAAAISACHEGFGNKTVFSHSLVKRFLTGTRRLRPVARASVPQWDLSTVLNALCAPPFEPLSQISLRLLSLKTALLLALCSTKRTLSTLLRTEMEQRRGGIVCARLGLERADTAAKAVDVIAELLEKYGQGGNCMEDLSGFTYHNSFLISDRTEAWVMETSGKYWVAERVQDGYRNISNQYSITTKIDKEHPGVREYAKSQGWWDGEALFSFAETYSFMDTARIEASGSRFCEGRDLLEKSKGHITAETMMDILRDKESGINMEGLFMTTGSMVSVVPTDSALPGVHYITGTPDPHRSVFKPFVFVKDIKQLKLTSSPSYGPEDPVKKIPRFQTKPDRKHPLFVKHEVVVAIIDTTVEKGKKILSNMREFEKEMMANMEKLLSSGIEDPTAVVHLFSNSVQEEISVYSKK